MRHVFAVLVLLALTACDRSADVRRAGQLRYEGHTLEEWWTLRRDPDNKISGDARTAMRMLGAGAVPYLAVKAAGPDVGDVIGGSVALESQCPGVLSAMEAARAHHPSRALDVAIQRVRSDSANRVRSALCSADGAPVRRDSGGGDPRPQMRP